MRAPGRTAPRARRFALSRRTGPISESAIREMTRLGNELGGVDLAQGLPDFDPPREVVAALRKVLPQSRHHQYSFTWGSAVFRAAVADKYARFNRMNVDPETEVTITCGVSEALFASILALTEPGDEVVLFEPWYENYFPACMLAGAVPRFVGLREPDYRFDASDLRRAIGRRTRLVLLNTPGNPSGRVFTREELSDIARLCQRLGLVAVVDEIYEQIFYPGHRHVSLGSLPGMEDRTVTLGGLSKTYAVTGWRVGWAVAAAPLTSLIRKIHDYLTVCAPAPFQEAGRAALALPSLYYEQMRRRYVKRRTILLDALSRAGFAFFEPEGAYYVMADAGPLGWRDGRAFADFLAREVGVIAVPGSSFYACGGGRTRVRLNFAKKEQTLREAARRLESANLRAPSARH